MNFQTRLELLSGWGHSILKDLDEGRWNPVIEQAEAKNPWFTKENSTMALKAIAERFLGRSKLNQWLSRYEINDSSPQTVALVMAGNIPLAGFHDLLCVLVAGHHAEIKCSRKDDVLLPALLEELYEIEPAFRQKVRIVGQLNKFDGVIATGSNNSARYFQHYFGQHPHIIRKNRNSAAILTGRESEEDLTALSTDIFAYFGLGCRNVSKLYLTPQFDFDALFEALEPMRPVIHHTKYQNNYIFNKSILIVNKKPHKDNGFLLFEEQKDQLYSPMALLHYEWADDEQAAIGKIKNQLDHLQCVVQCDPSDELPSVKPGMTQYPELWDYADGKDTLNFLINLGKETASN